SSNSAGPRGSRLCPGERAEIGWFIRWRSTIFQSSETLEDHMSFRITGLPAERFSHLFALSEAELVAQGAVRQIADARKPGYPCRISLTDSKPGDELVLVNYEHHDVDS